MGLDVWIAFGLTSFAITMSPGPIVLFAVHTVQQRGLTAGVLLIPAIILGDTTAMLVSLSGVGVLLAAAPGVAAGLKLIGAGVLVWVGVQSLRAAGHATGNAPPRSVQHRPAFFTAFALAALHPGAFVFYAAFFPQFIVSEDNALMHIALLSSLFLAVAALSLGVWMGAASVVTQPFSHLKIMDHLKRLAGLLMVAIGVASAVATLRAMT